MNCSFACARACEASSSAAARAEKAESTLNVLMEKPPRSRNGASVSMWERPQPELLLACLPEAGEPVRLDREKEEDERAEQDDLHVRREARARVREEFLRDDVQED